MEDPNRQLRDSIKDYFNEHGYMVNTSFLNSLAPNYPHQTAMDYLISQSAELEDVSEMPKMYSDLVDFVYQVPTVQQLQLKPLLFAFFYHTIVELFESKRESEAKAFFDHFQFAADGSKMFHVFHDSDIKKLNQYLHASSLSSKQSSLSNTTFSTSLTETTYQALVAFLMDRSYTRFLKILSQKVKITFISLDHFTARPDHIPGFIFYTTDQSEHPIEPVIHLLKDGPLDLARKYIGPNCTFEIFDDDHKTTDPGFPLPRPPHDRILAISNDILNMMPLSKNNLPSCAYFTFHHENVSYDINGSGTLIAAATDRNYVKLISTNASTDLDDNLLYQQIESRNNHMMIPRPINPSTGAACTYTRTIVGPRTYCVRFSPDSKFLLCGQQSSIRINPCEVSTGFSNIPTFGGITWCADWSPLGYHFVTGCDESVGFLWALDHSKPLRVFVNHQEPITDIKYHPNASTIATASYDCSVMLWDIRCDSNSPFTKMFASTVDVPRVIQFTRNGRIIIRGDESGKISTWDIGEGRKIGTIKAHRNDIVDMTLSMEGTILATTDLSGEVLLWDVGTICSTSANGAEPLRHFQPRNAYTHRLVFSNRNLLHAIGTSKKPKQ